MACCCRVVTARFRELMRTKRCLSTGADSRLLHILSLTCEVL